MENVKSIHALILVNTGVLIVSIIFFLFGSELKVLCTMVPVSLFSCYYIAGLGKIADGYKVLFTKKKTRENSLVIAHCSAMVSLFYLATYYEKVFLGNSLYRQMIDYFPTGSHQSKFVWIILIFLGACLYGISYWLMMENLRVNEQYNPIDDSDTNAFYLKVLISAISLLIVSILLFPFSVFYITSLITIAIVAIFSIIAILLLRVLVSIGKNRKLAIIFGLMISGLSAVIFTSNKPCSDLTFLHTFSTYIACGFLIAVVLTLLGRWKYIRDLDTWVNNMICPIYNSQNERQGDEA